MKQLLWILHFLAILSLPAFAANDVYLANAAAGGNTGVDCADAFVYTWFNVAGHYSATPSGQASYGPDTTVHLCGTIGSSTVGSNVTLLTAQGSGTSGHPLILKFESGAILQAPDFGSGNAAIVLDNQSYITVDGGGTGNAAKGTFVANGIIQATLSGTSGGTCIGGTCSHNNGGTGISGTTTDHLIIKNLEIQDMYLRSSFADQAPDWATYFCIHASVSNNILIDNDYLVESGEIIAINGSNMEVRNSYTAQTNHSFSLGAASTSYTNTFIHDNHIGSMDHWNAGSPFPYHHDGIHIFPAGPGFYLSVFIYNNTFDGDIGNSAPTGWIYAEQSCCTGGTIWVFNNYATISPYTSAPAAFGIYGASTINFVNNTLEAAGYTGGGVGCDLGNGAGITIALAQNNICGTQSYGWNVHSGTTVSGTAAMDYNSYVDGTGQSGNSGSMNYGGVNTNSLATYQSTAIPGAATHDAHSQLNTLSAYKLNTDGSLQSGSPAIGAGLNLFSTCNGQANPGLGALCSDKNGVVRPTSAAWDAGAIQFSSTPTVATPTFSPVAGTYASAQSVTISTSTGGATLCYTTDGTTPTANGAGTCTHGTTYSTAVSVAVSETLKAVGSLSGETDSSVGSAIYTITAAAPSGVISNGVLNGGFIR
jgi:hypothetical protein